jgi:hypothetical protein
MEEFRLAEDNRVLEERVAFLARALEERKKIRRAGWMN